MLSHITTNEIIAFKIGAKEMVAAYFNRSKKACDLIEQLLNDTNITPAEKLLALVSAKEIRILLQNLNSQTMRHLLVWLNRNLTQKNIPADQVLILLGYVDENNAHVGHYITEKKEMLCIYEYLGLLSNLSKQNTESAQQVFNLVKKATDTMEHTINRAIVYTGAYTVGCWIARRNDTQALLQYIDLLKYLTNHGIDIQPVHYVNSRLAYLSVITSTSFCEIIAGNKDVIIIFELIQNGLIPASHYSHFDIDQINRYVSSLSGQEKTSAEQAIVNPEHPLGQFALAAQRRTFKK